MQCYNFRAGTRITMNFINRSRSTPNMISVTAGLLAFVLVIQLSACGTIFYPERKGLSGGRLDPAVVVLDGLGLIFFLIPGLVALGVDFYNGTIYLPGTQTTQLSDEELKQIQQQGSVNINALERVLSEKLNQRFTIDNNTQVIKFHSARDLAAAVNFANPRSTVAASY